MHKKWSVEEGVMLLKKVAFSLYRYLRMLLSLPIIWLHFASTSFTASRNGTAVHTHTRHVASFVIIWALSPFTFSHWLATRILLTIVIVFIVYTQGRTSFACIIGFCIVQKWACIRKSHWFRERLNLIYNFVSVHILFPLPVAQLKFGFVITKCE